MTYNITMVPSKEGFVGIADIPTQSQVQKPQMNLWNTPQLIDYNPKTNTPEKKKESKMPVLVHVYVGSLTILGLYFLYRCTKN